MEPEDDAFDFKKRHMVKWVSVVLMQEEPGKVTSD